MGGLLDDCMNHFANLVRETFRFVNQFRTSKFQGASYLELSLQFEI